MMCQKVLEGSHPDHQLPYELTTIIIPMSQLRHLGLGRVSVSPQSEPEVGSPRRRAEEEPGLGTMMPATLTPSPAFFKASPGRTPSPHLQEAFPIFSQFPRLFPPGTCTVGRLFCVAKNHTQPFTVLSSGEVPLGAKGLQPEHPCSGCQEP